MTVSVSVGGTSPSDVGFISMSAGGYFLVVVDLPQPVRRRMPVHPLVNHRMWRWERERMRCDEKPTESHVYLPNLAWQRPVPSMYRHQRLYQ